MFGRKNLEDRLDKICILLEVIAENLDAQILYMEKCRKQNDLSTLMYHRDQVKFLEKKMKLFHDKPALRERVSDEESENARDELTEQAQELGLY